MGLDTDITTAEGKVACDRVRMIHGLVDIEFDTGSRNVTTVRETALDDPQDGACRPTYETVSRSVYVGSSSHRRCSRRGGLSGLGNSLMFVVEVISDTAPRG